MPSNGPVLVVGGTRGTGLLIARLLLRKGFAVRVLARNAERAVLQLGSAVEVMGGDMTKPATLPRAVQNVKHIICTAGVRSARPASESDVRATDYQGVLNVIEAARGAGFRGRFLYMNSIGVATFSISAAFLNLLKRNTLIWRRRLESEIRASGLDYTIIRAGFLVNAAAGQRAVEVTQGALPLSPRYVIARADVAEALVAAMEHPRASRATFEIVWVKGHRKEDWEALLSHLHADA